MSEELRECPFCGGTRSISVLNFFTRGSYRKCDICGAEAPEGRATEEAEVLWNNRPTEDALKAEVRRLTQALESIAKNAEFWDDEDDSLAVIYRVCKRALSDRPDTERGEEDES